MTGDSVKKVPGVSKIKEISGADLDFWKLGVKNERKRVFERSEKISAGGFGGAVKICRFCPF